MHQVTCVRWNGVKQNSFENIVIRQEAPAERRALFKVCERIVLWMEAEQSLSVFGEVVGVLQKPKRNVS